MSVITLIDFFVRQVTNVNVTNAANTNVNNTPELLLRAKHYGLL